MHSKLCLNHTSLRLYLLPGFPSHCPPKMLVYIVLKHYLPVILCISSCLCVIPSIYIFWRSGLCRPIAAYLVTMAIVDLNTGFLLMFLSLDHFLLQFMSNDKAHSTYSLVEDLFGELVDILLLISNWLTVAVAVERYLAICYPLYVRCLSHRVRKRIVLCIIFTATILQLPSLAKYWSVLDSLSIALSYFNLWFTRVLVLLIFPCTILICVNVRLIQTIRSSFILKHYTFAPSALDFPSNECSTSDCKSNNARATRLTVPFTVNGSLAREVGQHASREERAIIINLTCLIAAFFLCQFPFIFLSVAFKLYEADGDNGAFHSANLTFPHKTFLCNEDFLNQTLHSALTSSTTAMVSAASTIIATELNILAYIRALSVIFLMLKGDLYFLLYCGLCGNLSRALKSFRHV